MSSRDPEKQRAYNKNYYARNKKSLNKRNRQYQQDNKESIAERMRRNHAKNRDRNNAHSREYNRLNQDERRIYAREYRRLHPESHRFEVKLRKIRLRNVAINDFTLKQWAALLDLFEYCCTYCGKSKLKLTIDHIIPVSREGYHTLSNIVPACQSCNSKKNNGPPLRLQRPLLVLKVHTKVLYWRVSSGLGCI